MDDGNTMNGASCPSHDEHCDRSQLEAALRDTERSLERQASRLSTFVAIQSDIAAAGLDLNSVMRIVVERAQRLTGAAGAIIEMARGEDMVCRAATGMAAPHLGIRLQRDCSLSGRCAELGRLLQCRDVETDPHVAREACRQIGVRSMILVPLQYDAETVGVLSVLWSEPNAFKDKDVESLQLVAGLLSSSIGQALEFDGRLDVYIERMAALERLQESEWFNRSILDSLSSYIVVIDENGVILAVNDTWTRRAATTTNSNFAGMAVGCNYLEACDQEAVTAPGIRDSLDGIRSVLKGDSDTFILEYPYVTTDGRMFFQARVTPLVGVRRGAVISYSDITERKQLDEALQESRQFSEQIVSAVAEGIVVYDCDTRCKVWNSFMEELTGLRAADVINKQAVEIFSHLRNQDSEQLWEKALAGERVQAKDFFYVDGASHSAWIAATYGPLLDSKGEIIGVIGTFTDVTERKLTEEHLFREAFHDPLTGLRNRALFIDRMSHVMDLAKRRHGYMFAVIFLDFDRFKLINDSLGHLSGDQLLVAVASRLEASVRPGDTVARFGGDEFALLLEDIRGVNDATLVADRIQAALTQPFHINGHRFITSVSMGIALNDHEYIQPEEMLRDADAAMYRAKAFGRARYELFNAEMHFRALELIKLETALAHALDRHELRLHYQPILSLKSGQITGFEALLRWEHPERGLILPGNFIDLAENGGLIVPIGEWVLRQACCQATNWQTQFPTRSNLPININLSCRQFSQPDLVDQIQRVLEDCSFDPTRLTVEITETTLMEDPDAAASMLAKLRAMGIQVALDDFGTGYSSLSYLHRFPIDVLKIDRSFISRINGQDENLEMVRAIVTLAQSLAIDVVAEGVETREQLSLLQALGCKYGQGHLCSAPVDSKAAGMLLIGEDAKQSQWEP